MDTFAAGLSVKRIIFVMKKERSLVIQLFNALEYSNSMKVVLKICSIILLDM